MMDIHEALKTLSPIDYSQFPSDPSTLSLYLAASLTDAHTLISSIPPPDHLLGSFVLPEPPNAAIAELQEQWKPVKLYAKDNPLNISVFKLAAKDGKGTWFARRSIHTDIPFRRFEAGLQQEFQQASQLGPVRGIGKDAQVHREVCELGKAEIYRLSAQFPGPSAPRDFVEGCLLSSAHSEDISSTEDTESSAGSVKDRLKQFTLISRPVLNHPKCGQRPGYVRGTYESVEFIREIPLVPQQLRRSHSTPTVSTFEGVASPRRPRGQTVGMSPLEAAEAAENCPVDWVMITRSDPGGSVPRWMVERGTPNGIVKDAARFLDWCREATHLDATQESTLTHTIEQVSQGDTFPAPGLAGVAVMQEQAREDFATSHGETSNNDGGPSAGAPNSLAAGMTSLAHPAISSPTNPTPPASPSGDEAFFIGGGVSFAGGDGDDDSDAASYKTFATADSSHDPPSRAPSMASTVTLPKSPEERALAQFLKEKQKLDERLQKETHRHTERERKISERHMKNMEKRELKYRRALEKANEKRRKNEEKREREEQKRREKEEKGRRNEIEELKIIVAGLIKENVELRQRIVELEQETKGKWKGNENENENEDENGLVAQVVTAEKVEA